MGLYGAVTKDMVVANVGGGISAEAYPGVPYDNEVVLFYSDVDPVHNAAVATGDAGYTPIHYHAQWFLVNGEPYEDGVTEDLAAGPAVTDPGDTRSNTLVRLLSTASETHVPTLQGLYMTIHAEDGFRYTWQNGDVVGDFAPREQYSAMLPPLKTKDAIIVAPAEGTYAVYDGNGYMTNPSDPDDFGVSDELGGMLRFLAFGPTNQAPIAVDDVAETPEDTSVVIDVLNNDSDPNGDPLTIVSVTQGQIGSVAIDNPSCCVLYTPNLNANGMDSFDYTVSDSNGVTSTATAVVDVTVTPVNDPPSITSTPVTAGTVNALYSYGVTADDVDLGDTPPDVLTFSLDVSPIGMTIDSATGVVSWTPTLFQLGTQDVTVTVADLASASDSQSYQVQVDAAGTGTDGPLFFATSGNGAVPGVAGPYNNADIYAYDGAAYSRVLSFVATMGFNANVDALDIVDEDTFYVSFANNTLTRTTEFAAFGGTANDEDVLLYDAGTWTRYFDGSLCGLDANNGQDIDAISIDNGTLYFSTTGGGNNNPVGGVAAPYDDADVYTWNGGTTGTANCGRALDANVDAGLPGNANVDGLTVRGGTYYLSFARNGGTNVPTLGTVQDEAVVSYDGTSWTLYFSGPGLDASNAQNVGAFDLP